MEIQLQELIEQIKKDGVEAAEAQAEEVINSAKAKAEKIIADAQAQAERILQEAKQENGDNSVPTKYSSYLDCRLPPPHTIGNFLKQMAMNAEVSSWPATDAGKDFANPHS